MQNYKQPGDVVTFTAPVGGVTSGLGYKVGQCFVVATGDAAATEEFEGRVVGVCELVKATGAAWTEGALLYWDDGASEVTTTASGNLLIGCAAVAAGSGDTVGEVRLNGIASADIP
jgi:predicted RecA/RadA family phage recombinase